MAIIECLGFRFDGDSEVMGVLWYYCRGTESRLHLMEICCGDYILYIVYSNEKSKESPQMPLRNLRPFLAIT